MATNRKIVDCRLFPADIPCQFAVSGDEEEILKVAVEHAREFHGYRDTPALRDQLRFMLRTQSMKKAA